MLILSEHDVERLIEPEAAIAAMADAYRRHSAGRMPEPGRLDMGRDKPKGSVLVMDFELEGQQFHALNGGPMYKFTPAISFMVSCEDQKEVDRLWSKLTADGGKEIQCGWLEDRFGLSWQIVPTVFMEMIGDKDQAKVGRVMAAMMQMVKFDIKKLQAAYDGR